MVTVKVKAAPCMTVLGALRTSLLAAAAVTVTIAAPCTELVAVSATVMVCEPAVLSVTALLKVWTPLSVVVKV